MIASFVTGYFIAGLWILFIALLYKAISNRPKNSEIWDKEYMKNLRSINEDNDVNS